MKILIYQHCENLYIILQNKSNIMPMNTKNKNQAF